jgi:hypothetical protein
VNFVVLLFVHTHTLHVCKCNKKYNENANELTINMDHGKVLMAFSC